MWHSKMLYLFLIGLGAPWVAEASLTIHELSLVQDDKGEYRVARGATIDPEDISPNKLYEVYGGSGEYSTIRVALSEGILPGSEWYAERLDSIANVDETETSRIVAGGVELYRMKIDINSIFDASFFQTALDLPDNLQFIFRVKSKDGVDYTDEFLSLRSSLTKVNSSEIRRRHLEQRYLPSWEELSSHFRGFNVSKRLPNLILLDSRGEIGAYFGFRQDPDGSWHSLPRIVEAPNSKRVGLWVGSLMPNRVFLFLEDDMEHPKYGSWRPYFLVASHIKGRLLKFPLGEKSVVLSKVFPLLRQHENNAYQLVSLPSESHLSGVWIPVEATTTQRLVNKDNVGLDLVHQPNNSWQWAAGEISAQDYALMATAPRAELELQNFVFESERMGFRLLFDKNNFNGLDSRPDGASLISNLSKMSALDQFTASVMMARLNNHVASSPVYAANTTFYRQVVPVHASETRPRENGNWLLPSISRNSSDRWLLPSIGGQSRPVAKPVWKSSAHPRVNQNGQVEFP